MAENWIRGRRRSIWVSISADLRDDAYRDLKDIGAGKIPVHDLKSFGVRANLQDEGLDEGVLFCTYSLLVSQDRSKPKKSKSAASEDAMMADGEDEGPRSRLQQIIEWCGDDFEGVIAFDEVRVSPLPLSLYLSFSLSISLSIYLSIYLSLSLCLSLSL